MAYALILSAESNKYKYVKNTKILDRIRICGKWLLNNSDLNGNGIHGYGLADSWDAFSDKTVNESNTEYTITNGLVLNSLLNWYAIEEDKTLKKEIYTTILNIIQPYLNDTFDTPNGLVTYSLNLNDKDKDVFNPAVYIAGQFQRISKITNPKSLETQLTDKATTIINSLLKHKLYDFQGNIYWNYGIEIKIPNDLVHTCYILEGVREYEHFNGKTQVEWTKILKHLLHFKFYGRWYERIGKKYQNRKSSSRLWALGMLMYTLAKEELYQEIKITLWPQILEYHLGNGRFRFHKYNQSKLIRQEAHLLLGLSYYIYNQQNFPENK